VGRLTNHRISFPYSIPVEIVVEGEVVVGDSETAVHITALYAQLGDGSIRTLDDMTESEQEAVTETAEYWLLEEAKDS
jgi:hypothetical protein